MTERRPGSRLATVDDWHEAVARHGWAEVVDGLLLTLPEDAVARTYVNAHNHVANQLAQQVREQWGLVAVSPGYWVLSGGDGRSPLRARLPDVLAGSSDILHGEQLAGAPELVAEVWSPTNTLADMSGKRLDYHAAGVPVLVEAHITETRDVHLEWHVRDARAGVWRLAGAAVGDEPMRVSESRPFEVVPNDLLAPGPSRTVQR